MNLETAIKKTKMLIDQYSTRGTLEEDDSNNLADYIKKMPFYFDMIQKEIATTQKHIKDSFDIIYSYPQNLITSNTFGLMKIKNNEEVEYKNADAKSFVFKAQGTGEAILEVIVSGEDTDDEIVTELYSYYIDSTELETYKGVIVDLPDEYENIRLRFTSGQIMNIRDVALFDIEYFSDDDIPIYSKYITNEMPSNFHKLSKVYIQRNDYFVEYSDFIFTHTNKLQIPWETEGLIKVDYIAMPEDIDSDTENSYVFEVSEEAAQAIPYKTASLLLIQEQPNTAQVLNAKFETIMLNIENEQSISSGRIRNTLYRG